MPNTVCPIVHVELKSADFDRTATFYRDLFGWQMQPFPEMSYLGFSAAGGPGGGFAKPEMSQAPGVLSYLGVADIDAKLAEVEKAGGRVVLGKMAVGDMGSMAIFTDLDGNAVGLWQAVQPAKMAAAQAKSAAKAKTKIKAKKPAAAARKKSAKRR